MRRVELFSATLENEPMKAQTKKLTEMTTTELDETTKEFDQEMVDLAAPGWCQPNRETRERWKHAKRKDKKTGIDCKN